MRYLARRPLPDRTRRTLVRWTEALRALPPSEQKGESDRRWSQRSPTVTIGQARDTLRQMNGGRDRCMYCEHDRGGHIDHFEPRERDPARTFDWLNMILSCERCNSAKGAKFIGPDGAPPIDPTVEDPAAHIELSPRDGRLIGLTPRGTWTIDALGLNASAALRGQRRDAWIKLQHLIAQYAQLVEQHEHEAAEELREAITEHPFPGALIQLVSLSHDPHPETAIRRDCLAVLRAHPEILNWTQVLSR